MPNFRSKC